MSSQGNEKHNISTDFLLDGLQMPVVQRPSSSKSWSPMISYFHKNGSSQHKYRMKCATNAVFTGEQKQIRVNSADFSTKSGINRDKTLNDRRYSSDSFTDESSSLKSNTRVMVSDLKEINDENKEISDIFASSIRPSINKSAPREDKKNKPPLENKIYHWKSSCYATDLRRPYSSNTSITSTKTNNFYFPPTQLSHSSVEINGTLKNWMTTHEEPKKSGYTFGSSWKSELLPKLTPSQEDNKIQDNRWKHKTSDPGHKLSKSCFNCSSFFNDTPSNDLRSLHSAATSIQRWFKRHSARRKAAVAALQRISKSKGKKEKEEIFDDNLEAGRKYAGAEPCRIASTSKILNKTKNGNRLYNEIEISSMVENGKKKSLIKPEKQLLDHSGVMTKLNSSQSEFSFLTRRNVEADKNHKEAPFKMNAKLRKSFSDSSLFCDKQKISHSFQPNHESSKDSKIPIFEDNQTSDVEDSSRADYVERNILRTYRAIVCSSNKEQRKNEVTVCLPCEVLEKERTIPKTTIHLTKTLVDPFTIPNDRTTSIENPTLTPNVKKPPIPTCFNLKPDIMEYFENRNDGILTDHLLNEKIGLLSDNLGKHNDIVDGTNCLMMVERSSSAHSASPITSITELSYAKDLASMKNHPQNDVHFLRSAHFSLNENDSRLLEKPIAKCSLTTEQLDKLSAKDIDQLYDNKCKGLTRNKLQDIMDYLDNVEKSKLLLEDESDLQEKKTTSSINLETKDQLVTLCFFDFEEAIRRHLAALDQLSSTKENLEEKYKKLSDAVKIDDNSRICSDNVPRSSEKHHNEPIMKNKFVNTNPQQMMMSDLSMEQTVENFKNHQKAIIKKLKESHQRNIDKLEEERSKKLLEEVETIQEQANAKIEQICKQEQKLIHKRYDKQFEQFKHDFGNKQIQMETEVHKLRQQLVIQYEQHKHEMLQLRSQTKKNQKREIEALQAEYIRRHEDECYKHKKAMGLLQSRFEMDLEAIKESLRKDQTQDSLVSAREQFKLEHDHEIELALRQLDEENKNLMAKSSRYKTETHESDPQLVGKTKTVKGEKRRTRRSTPNKTKSNVCKSSTI